MNNKRTRTPQWFFAAAILLVAVAAIALWPRSASQVNVPPEAKQPVATTPAVTPPQSPVVKALPAPDVQAAAAPVAAPAVVATVPTPPAFPGEMSGKPWLDIPGWKLLTPRAQVVKLLERPFGIQHSGTVRTLELAKDELYYRHVENPKARVTTIPAQATAEGVLREAEAVKAASGHLPRLVLYPVGTLREERTDKNRLTISEQVLMEAADEDAAVASAKQVGLADAAPMSAAPGFVLGNDHRFPGSAIVAAAELDTAQGVKTSRAMLAYQSAKKSLPFDPLLAKQWHLKKPGIAKAQVDINVEPVWDDGYGGSFKGTGITVAVVDDGIEIAHPDLVDRCPLTSSLLHYNWNGVPGSGDPPTLPGDVNDPTPYRATDGTDKDAHGTACAGLIGATENSIGGVGVAPGVRLLGYRLIAAGVTIAEEAEAMGRDNNKIHIKSNSWGPEDGPGSLAKLDPVLATAMKTAAETGRGGLGVIMPWAAGNAYEKGDQAGHDGYAGSIYHIPVGVISANGKISAYSERGACLMASAPGDLVYTTDLTGASGNNRTFTLNGANIEKGSKILKVADSSKVFLDFLITGAQFSPGTMATDVDDATNTISLSKPALAAIANGTVTVDAADPAGPTERDYTGTMNGTSAATPVVAGVVALMLEANPTLGWRDVAEILLRSSTQLEPASTELGGWVSRDGGEPSIGLPIKHHHAYGGGSVDAATAVSLAQRWNYLNARGTPLTKDTGATPLNLTIPENVNPKTEGVPTGTVGLVRSFDFSTDTPTRVEQVEVTLSLTHPLRGQLQIELKSPSGAVSILKKFEKRDTNTNGYDQFIFTSNRHWGESSKGTWSVTVKDVFKGAVGKLNEVAITLHGVPHTPVAWDNAPGSTPDALNVIPAGLLHDFIVSATGDGEISYRWLKNGVAIPNETFAVLTLPYVTAADAGNYVVEARNATGTVTSAFAVGVIAAPADTLVLAGKTLSLKATFTPPPAPKPPATLPPITYQWSKDSTDLSNGVTPQGSTIAGATLPTLAVSNCQATASATDAGAYQVKAIFGAANGLSGACNVDVGRKSDIGLTAFPTDLIVSGEVSIDLLLANGQGPTAVTFSPALPAGLTYDKATGRITGTPKTPVNNLAVKIIATNVAGTTTKTLILNIAALPPRAIGTFDCVIDRVAGLYLDSVHGGESNFTIMATGDATGQCVLGPSILPGSTTPDSATFRFTGRLKAVLNQDPTITFRVAPSALPAPYLAPKAGLLSFTISRADGSVTGNFKPDVSPVTTTSAHGFRVTPKAGIGTRHNFFLDPITPGTSAQPQGPIVGSLLINGSTGKGTASLRFPDGSDDGKSPPPNKSANLVSVLETVFLGPNGEVYIHHAEPSRMVSSNGSGKLAPSQVVQSLIATLTINEQAAPFLDTVHGSGSYIKLPPTPSASQAPNYYPLGFDFGFTNANVLTAQGSEWRLTPGAPLWGELGTPSVSAKFYFQGGNIEATIQFKNSRYRCEPTVALTGTGTFPVSFRDGLPYSPLFTYIVNSTTGEVQGSFFPYSSPQLAPIIPGLARFYGFISLGDFKARGHVLVKQYPYYPATFKVGSFELR